MNTNTKTAGTAQTLSAPGISRAPAGIQHSADLPRCMRALRSMDGGLFLRPDNIMNNTQADLDQRDNRHRHDLRYHHYGEHRSVGGISGGASGS